MTGTVARSRRQPPEWLERRLYVCKVASNDSTASEGLECGLPQELRRQAFARAVVRSPLDGGDWHRAEPCAVLLREVGVVERQPFGQAEAAPLPRARNGKMELSGHCIGESMERERGLVREDPGLLRPEPLAHERRVLSSWKVNEPVDAATDANGAPAREVVNEQLWGLAGLCRLARREETLLSTRNFIQAVPIGTLVRLCRDAQNVSRALVLCKTRGGADAKSGFASVRKTGSPGHEARGCRSHWSAGSF